jgi:glucose-6-phosphate isomerase
MSADHFATLKPAFVDWSSGHIVGEDVEEAVKTLGQLAGLFHDEEAFRSIPTDTEVYRVQSWKPVSDGNTGGLFWGSTVLQPGRVGDEFFMTHGHFHSLRDRAEIYATVRGTGAMIFMDEARQTWSQPMAAGSVHYIPGKVAHRVANTGDIPLAFLACWPSDAGHDYAQIRATGFSKRMLLRNGEPCLL